MITSYVVKNDMIHIQVQGSSRTFVYPQFKFGSKHYLMSEINKSLALESRKTTKKVARFNKMEQEIDDEIRSRP